MAKFCGNCGAASDDNANICGNCGAPFAASKSGAGNILSKIPGVSNININSEQKDLITKIAKIAVPAIAGLVAVLVLIFAIIVPNTGARGAVKKYFKAIVKEDVKAYIELMPEINKVNYEENESMNLEDDIEDYLKEEKDYLEDEYGKNVKIKIKVTEVDELSNKRKDAIEEEYERTEGVSKGDFEDAVEVEFDITIKGKDDKDEGDGKVIVIKEEGKWKIWGDPDLDI